MTPERAPLLLHVFPTFAVGGAQARFATLANGFGDRYRHAIIAMDGNLACAARLSPLLDISYPAVDVRKADGLGNVRRFARLLRRLRPDVLVTSNWGSIEWAAANLFARVPHLHMEDGFGPDERARQLPRRIWARRMLLRRSLIMLPSRTLHRLAAETWKLDEVRLRYIPNGIDLARFRAADRAAHDAAEPVVGTVAALRGEKNIARLVRAFAVVRRRRPARLVIVGDGEERPALEKLVQELGLKEAVTFAGHLEETQRAYAGFDVFALSSDTEQMPLSVLEAMGAGLAIAATNVGDIVQMVAAANAPLVVACDDDALADALDELLSDPALAGRLGAANRLRAERDFDQSTMIEAHAALIEEVRTRRPTSLRLARRSAEK